MILISSEKIRAILKNAKTEQETIFILRSHKIKYFLTTETGFFSIRIPCRKGCVRIYRTATRLHPMTIRFEKKGA